jgi:hypothetical protein
MSQRFDIRESSIILVYLFNDSQKECNYGLFM